MPWLKFWEMTKADVYCIYVIFKGIIAFRDVYCIHIIFIGVISTADCTLCDECLHQKCLVFGLSRLLPTKAALIKRNFLKRVHSSVDKYNSYGLHLHNIFLCSMYVHRFFHTTFLMQIQLQR